VKVKPTDQRYSVAETASVELPLAGGHIVSPRNSLFVEN